jgi:uncharacterized membrane protein
MRWYQIHRFRYSVRSSLWIIPIIAIPLAMIATRIAHWLDPRLQWTFLGFGVKGAEALLQATVTATLSFLAFTFASLLVALQVASGQLTPRIIATILLSNNIVRYTVGLFIFTLLFAIGAQNRIESLPIAVVSRGRARFIVLCRFFVPDRLRLAIVAANLNLDASRE